MNYLGLVGVYFRCDFYSYFVIYYFLVSDKERIGKDKCFGF